MKKRYYRTVRFNGKIYLLWEEGKVKEKVVKVAKTTGKVVAYVGYCALMVKLNNAFARI